MRHAPNRGRRRLRLVRTRVVRRVRQIFRDAAHGLLRPLWRRPHPCRAGDGIDPAEERAKRPGQRVLSLFVRRVVAGGGGRRMVLSALAFLIYFTAGCGAVFIASGFWYGRIARKKS